MSPRSPSHAGAHVRRGAAVRLAPALLLALAIAQGSPLAPTTAAAAVCDPPGPAPRFGCTWSTDTCAWVCAVCDPFGAPPRSSCTWDGDRCTWICPGYTGVEVTLRILEPPGQDATLHVRLSSLCTATGMTASCAGGFDVYPGMSAGAKCQAIADAIGSDCAPAGYAVTSNACAPSASLTASNVGCPATPFAMGLSDDPGVFDQTEDGPLPDGESDEVTGSDAACALAPGPVTDLLLATVGGGDVQLTWGDAVNADDYVVFTDTSADGPFDTVAGTATSGAAGITLPMATESRFYLVAGRNAACGLGPEH
jgi:hypothetical protein